MNRSDSLQIDGVMLNYFIGDPNLSSYSVVMLDEAHERSVNTDALFGILKCLLQRRLDLKVVVTSATLDCEKFSQYFNDAPILNVPGRVYPVEIIHSNNLRFGPTDTDQIVTATVSKVLEIHSEGAPGDILVFMPGQMEIDRVIEKIKDGIFAIRAAGQLDLYPCYASMPWETQQQIFNAAPIRGRKVVVATNIAETSVTIDGIVYVVDSGIGKVSTLNLNTGVVHLNTIRITKAQANQRSGRAGRTQPGKAYRLYSEADYEGFEESPTPEIQRLSVVDIAFKLLCIGITPEFKFMDPPSEEMMRAAVRTLQDLGAINENQQIDFIGVADEKISNGTRAFKNSGHVIPVALHRGSVKHC